MNPLNDISAVYVAEVLKPQLGQEKQAPAAGANAKGTEGPANAEKRVRQAVYDIRYRARREDVPLEQAFSQYMSHTSMGAAEKNEVKEKLGIGPGGGSVKEEIENKKYQVRVKDKATGKSYVRYATRQKINQLRSNPNISSVEMTKYGTPYEGEKQRGKYTGKVKSGKGLDPVGREDKDIDNDGDHDKTDKYLLNRRKVRGAAIAKKTGMKESFSNWREDLREIVDDEIASKKKSQVKGMKKDESNNVTINPKLGEEVQLLESFEISEDYLNQTVNTAAEYFCEQGLNERGVDILIEELGLDEFVNFVFEIQEENLLSEARAGGVRVEPKTKGGKSVGSLKGGAKTAAINRLRKEKAARKEAESKASESKPSGFKSFSQKHAAVQTAKKQQPKRKGVLDRVAGAVLKGMERHKQATAAASQAFKQGVERHKAATTTASKLASQTAQTAAKAAGKVGGVAKEVGSGAKTAAKVGKRVLTGEEFELQEKITAKTDMGTAIKDFYASKSPQLAGRSKEERRKAAIAAVLTARRGGKKLGEALDQKIQDQPTPSDDNVRSAQSDAVKKQQLQNLKMIQQKRRMLDNQKLQLQRSGKLPLENSYEPEGEQIDERTAFAKRTGMSATRPGKPSVKGGAKDDPAFISVKRVIRKMEGTPAGQRKRDPGKKPPAAGTFGGPESPAQKVAKRRAAAARSQEWQQDTKGT